MLNQGANFRKNTGVENGVSEPGIVAGDISETPNCLLFDFQMGDRVSDGDQDRDGTILDELEHELAVARSNIRQAPDSLKLKLGRLLDLTQVQQSRNHVHVHSLLNRWVLFERHQFSEADGGQNLVDQAIRAYALDDLIEVFLLFQGTEGS